MTDKFFRKGFGWAATVSCYFLMASARAGEPGAARGSAETAGVEWSAETVLRQMKAASARLKSLEFSYRQETRSELSPEVQLATGSARFRKPRALRIEQETPERQLVISEGKTVWIYTPRFRQALKNSWERWMEQNAFFPGVAGFEEALAKLEKGCRWSLLGKETVASESLLRLSLDCSDSGTPHAELWISADDFLPRRTVVRSGSMTVTTQLSGVRLDPPLGDERFKFNRPKGTEIIKLP